MDRKSLRSVKILAVQFSYTSKILFFKGFLEFDNRKESYQNHNLLIILMIGLQYAV